MELYNQIDRLRNKCSETSPAFLIYQEFVNAIQSALYNNTKNPEELTSQSYERKRTKGIFGILENMQQGTTGHLLKPDYDPDKVLNKAIRDDNKKYITQITENFKNHVIPYYKYYYYVKTARLYCSALKIPFQGVFSYDTVKTLKKWYLIDQYVTKNRCKTNKKINLEALNNSLNITKDFKILLTQEDIKSYFEDYRQLETKINTIKEICTKRGITNLKDARDKRPEFKSKGISESVLKLYFENYTKEAIWNYKCSFMKDICEDLITLGWNQNNYQNSLYLQRISTDEEGKTIKMPFTEKDLERYWPIFEQQQKNISPEEKMENILKYYNGKYADCVNYTSDEIAEAKKRQKEQTEKQREEKQAKGWDSKKEQIKKWLEENKEYFNNIKEVLNANEKRSDLKKSFKIPHLITYEDFQKYQEEVEENQTYINTNPTTPPQNNTSENQPTPQGISGRHSSKPAEAEEKITPQQAFFDNILHDEKRVINDLASLIKKTNGKSWKNINWNTLTTKFNSIKNNNQVLLSKIKRSTSKDPRNQQEKEGVLPLWRNIALHINNQNGTYTVVDIKNDYQYAA